MTKHQKLDVKLQRYSPDAPGIIILMLSSHQYRICFSASYSLILFLLGDSFAKLSLEEKSELSESSEEEESKVSNSYWWKAWKN